MANVVSIVRGRVSVESLPDLVRRYEAGAKSIPPTIVRTELLTAADGSVAVVTTWVDRAALDAMLASGDEPFARRLIREAGGQPEAAFFEVAAEATQPST